MYCPECGEKNDEYNEVCDYCGSQLISKDNSGNEYIVTFLMNLPIEKFLKWGGLVIILLGIAFSFPNYLLLSRGIQNQSSGIFRLYNTANGFFSTVMRGALYYGLGVIIQILKGIKD